MVLSPSSLKLPISRLKGKKGRIGKCADSLMKILLVQESDWLKRNPHQQHHLMKRLSLRGHEVAVIDYNGGRGGEKTPN